jgi:MFS transporter, OFA family, oxalate/formate antiporter
MSHRLGCQVLFRFEVIVEGAKFAAANAGTLYTAKGVGSLLVPVAASIAKSQGWGMVLTIVMCFNLQVCPRCSFSSPCARVTFRRRGAALQRSSRLRPLVAPAAERA